MGKNQDPGSGINIPERNTVYKSFSRPHIIKCEDNFHSFLLSALKENQWRRF
jgi:hypothetical protein